MRSPIVVDPDDPNYGAVAAILARKPPIDSRAGVVARLRQLLYPPDRTGEHCERLAVLALGGNHELVGAEILHVGSLASVVVSTRAVMRWALTRQEPAYAVVVAHNHPRGCPEPSESDKALSEKLSRAAEACEVRLMDQLIITPTQCYSMRDGATVREG